MEYKHITALVNLTMNKVQILKLKADDHAWACYVDDNTKQQLEITLTEIDNLLDELRTVKPIKATRIKLEINPNEVISLYNVVFAKHPVTLKLKPTSALITRIKVCIRKEFKDLPEWNKYFQLIKMNDFLMGKIAPSNGFNKQFRLSLDFIINETNIAKILEGRI